MYGKDKSYKLYTVLGWPVATLIIVFTAGLLLWMYGESIEAINNENRLGMEQRHTAIDFVLANNIANIEQGLREVRDTTPLVNAIIRDDKHDAKDILIQLTDVMQNPPLDVVFIQLWDGKLFTEVTSPFFNLAESIGTLGNAVKPSLDNGGLLSVNGLSILAASEPLLKKDTGRVVGRIVGGTVLNDNLAILDTIHQLTKSEIVVLTNDGEIISSTAPQSSKIVQRLAKKTIRRTADTEDHLDTDFGSGLIAGYIPITVSGEKTSLVAVTAVPDNTYSAIQDAYRLHTFAMIAFSAFVILFILLLVRASTKKSLHRLLTYARTASTEDMQTPYQTSLIEEFNTIGQAMEIMVGKINRRTAKLARTSHQLELAMQGGRFGLWDWDIKTGQATYGRIWEEILGFDTGEIPDEYTFWERRVHPDDRNSLIAAINRCRRGESSYFLKDHRIKTKQNDWVWVAARGAVSEKDDTGAPKRMTGIIVDITERKKAEAKLKDSERRHRAIFENSPLGMVHYSETGSILDCNEHFADLMGSPRDKLIGFDTANLSPSKMQDALKAALRGSPSLYEDTYTSVTGGKTTYLRGIFSPIRLGASPTDVIATFEDISRRKSAEDDLKRTQKLLDDAQTLGNIGAWEYDADIGDEIWTDNLFRLYGYEPGELDERHRFFFEQILHPDDRDRVSEMFDSISNRAQPLSSRFRIIRKDGQERQLEGLAVPQADYSGRVKRIYGVNHDITALARAEDEALRAREQAETASESKSAFLANMSDEIRTPLQDMLQFLELLADTNLTEQQKEHAAAVIRSTEHLDNLLTDVLDLSKVEEGTMVIKAGQFDLHKAVEDVIKRHEPTAEQSGIGLAVAIKEDTPRHVVGDVHRVQQVLSNLVGNAVKFTELGTVNVDVTPLPYPQNENCTILFTVCDTGVGISDEHIEGLIKPLQKDKAGAAGTGLGLTISKDLVALMGGSMAISPTKEKGTCVYFSLPFKTAADSNTK